MRPIRRSHQSCSEVRVVRHRLDGLSDLGKDAIQVSREAKSGSPNRLRRRNRREQGNPLGSFPATRIYESEKPKESLVDRRRLRSRLKPDLNVSEVFARLMSSGARLDPQQSE